jgi:membrane-bound serine protease (ClpP class)
MGLKAQSRKPETGDEGIIGETGEVLEKINLEGKVFVHGEYWQGSSKLAIDAGHKIIVIGKKGMLLIVEEIHDNEPNL